MNGWLKDLMHDLGWEDRQATLHALRDRLTVDEVAQLGAQLPMLIRGLYYEGWAPTGKPLRERHEAQFLIRISREFSDEARGGSYRSASEIARAVFTVLARRVTEGEIEDVKHILRAELRELWPAAGRSTRKLN